MAARRAWLPLVASRFTRFAGSAMGFLPHERLPQIFGPDALSETGYSIDFATSRHDRGVL